MATPKTVGNLIGEPFEDYVNGQINRRQKIHGKSNRTLDEIQYLSNKNAWVKLASGVSIEKERLQLLKKNGNSLITDANITTGQDLAQTYTLFNGLTEFSPTFTTKQIGTFSQGPLKNLPKFKTITAFSQQQRSGVRGLANNPNPAYGVGGTDFGYSPMPGIVDMEFRCLNRGSIKKATLNIKAHNRDQFDIIDVLYLRLGYSVFLEWGWDKYIDNKGKLKNMGETLIDGKFWSSEYNKSDYSEWLPEIEKKRKETDGNYDGAFGTVSNFSWDFASDGTYDIKVEIISLGDIIESLRVDLPPTLSTDISPLLAANFTSLLRNPDDEVDQNIFYGTLYKNLDKVIENWYNRGLRGEGTPPSIKLGTLSSGVTPPTSAPICVIFQNFSYNNPLAVGNIDPDFPLDVSSEDIQKAIAFSLVHSVVKFDNSGNYFEWPTRISPTSFPYDSDNKSYGYFGTNWLVENDNDKNIYPSFQGLNTDGSNYWKSIRQLQKTIPEAIRVNLNARISTSVGFDYYGSLIPVPVESNIKVFNAPFKFPRSPARYAQSGSVGSIPLPNPLFKFNVGYSSAESSDPNNYTLNNRYPDLRRVWQENYDNVKTSNPKAAWRYLLDTTINNVRFSPSVDDIKKGVYNYFRLQGRARPIPITATAVSSSADPDDFDLEQEALEEKKDLQKKNLNRIYRFFYDIRTKNKSSEPDPFIKTTLGPVDFVGVVKIFENIPFGDYVLARDGTKPIIHLTGMGNLTQNYFIKLDYFLSFLQERIIPKIETTGDGKPMITFDGINPDGIIEVDQDMVNKTICYVIDNTMFLDIRKLIISNPYFIRGLSDPNDPNTIIPQPIFPEGLETFVEKSSSDRLFYGKIMNVYFNFARLEEIFDSGDLTKPVVLFEALKTICNDINDALGGVNNIEPVINENNVIRFIDQTPIPGLETIATDSKVNISNFGKSSKEAVLEIYGYNNVNSSSPTSNFVTNIGISTQIDKNYATAITIGATANGGVPGIEATAFSKWNRGITDRFKNNLLDATDSQPQVAFTASVPYQNTRDTYAEFLNQNFSIVGLNEDANKSINEDFIKFNKNSASSWYKVMQTANSIEENGATESSIGFLPFNLKVDIDGLSGIKIYNRVQVNTSFLPSNYPDTLEFIITQVNHKLSANGWVTSLETIATAKNQKI
jgi:hypothetical protein